MNSEPLSKSIPRIVVGACLAIHSRPVWTCTNALLRMLRSMLQPVTTSVADKVRRNSPFKVWPQWATVSSSRKPGWVIGSSVAARTGIEDRRMCDGLVLDRLAAG